MVEWTRKYQHNSFAFYSIQFKGMHSFMLVMILIGQGRHLPDLPKPTGICTMKCPMFSYACLTFSQLLNRDVASGFVSFGRWMKRNERWTNQGKEKKSVNTFRVHILCIQVNCHVNIISWCFAWCIHPWFPVRKLIHQLLCLIKKRNTTSMQKCNIIHVLCSLQALHSKLHHSCSITVFHLKWMRCNLSTPSEPSHPELISKSRAQWMSHGCEKDLLYSIDQNFKCKHSQS